jgi:hypothetical protein
MIVARDALQATTNPNSTTNARHRGQQVSSLTIFTAILIIIHVLSSVS